MRHAIAKFLTFLRREDGPTAVESALFFSLVALVCMLSVKAAMLRDVMQP